MRPIVYRSPSAAFRIAKPVEHKQRIAAGAGEVPIPGGACLIAMESMSSTMALGGCRAPADNPSHRGIASRAVGVVYVLMATEAAEDGLAKQSRHRVPAVLAGARIDRLMAGHVRQAERVIRLAAGRPSGVGGDSGTVELELQAAVETEPKRPVDRFTRRVRHMPRPKMRSRHCFLMTEPTINHINQWSRMGNAGYKSTPPD